MVHIPKFADYAGPDLAGVGAADHLAGGAQAKGGPEQNDRSP